MIIAVLIALAQVATPSKTTILGFGNNSCGAWTVAKQEDGWSRIAYQSWLGGFISGVNLGGARAYGNLTDGTDMRGLTAWMDNYCAAHPLDAVGVAASNLAAELLTRKIPQR